MYSILLLFYLSLFSFVFANKCYNVILITKSFQSVNGVCCEKCIKVSPGCQFIPMLPINNSIIANANNNYYCCPRVSSNVVPSSGAAIPAETPIDPSLLDLIKETLTILKKHAIESKTTSSTILPTSSTSSTITTTVTNQKSKMTSSTMLPVTTPSSSKKPLVNLIKEFLDASYNLSLKLLEKSRKTSNTTTLVMSPPSSTPSSTVATTVKPTLTRKPLVNFIKEFLHASYNLTLILLEKTRRITDRTTSMMSPLLSTSSTVATTVKPTLTRKPLVNFIKEFLHDSYNSTLILLEKPRRITDRSTSMMSPLSSTPSSTVATTVKATLTKKPLVDLIKKFLHSSYNLTSILLENN